MQSRISTVALVRNFGLDAGNVLNHFSRHTRRPPRSFSRQGGVEATIDENTLPTRGCAQITTREKVSATHSTIFLPNPSKFVPIDDRRFPTLRCRQYIHFIPQTSRYLYTGYILDSMDWLDPTPYSLVCLMAGDALNFLQSNF